MDCSTFRDLLPRILSEGTDGDRRAQLASHASGCLQCGRMLRDWEEAQRAIENAIGTALVDPTRFDRVAELVRATPPPTPENAVTEASVPPVAPRPEPQPAESELDRPVPAVRGSDSAAMHALIGGAIGIGIGFMMWGTGESRSGISGLLELQMMERLGVGAGGFGGLANPSMFNLVPNLAAEIFSAVMVVWLSRNRLWEQFSIQRLPRSLDIARAAAVPVLVLGILSVGSRLLIGPFFATGVLAMPGGGSPELYTFGFQLLGMGWKCGFWLVLALCVVSFVEVTVGRTAPGAGRGRSY